MGRRPVSTSTATLNSTSALATATTCCRVPLVGPSEPVYRLLRSGELDLPVIRVGSSPRVRRLDLEQHLARPAADEEEAAAARRERAALLLRPRQRVPTARR
jgi:hypothetical protein